MFTGIVKDLGRVRAVRRAAEETEEQLVERGARIEWREDRAEEAIA